ncbi:MAG: hypothetical protein KC475_06090 [Cyanobacteria bacterium HKST-UBA03]|nr:hypothetical protein [Cyanobacteria bacterium HKST-UBA03]
MAVKAEAARTLTVPPVAPALLALISSSLSLVLASLTLLAWMETRPPLPESLLASKARPAVWTVTSLPA